MSNVLLPPQLPILPDGSKLGGWWHASPEQGRIICDLCPRACHLQPGDRGFCFVRENRDGQMVLNTYGRSTGFCIDPIEKKPLNHFLPGTAVLSFGTAGCNLGCKFCQNWSLSKSREVEQLSERADAVTIANAASQLNCRSVAFTYNDPVIWAEYAIDVAKACHEKGIKTVAVTAGYITPQAREPFFSVMDAANVDLKAFTEKFYQQFTLSHLQPVLDTLEWLKRETQVWFEITNLVIPDANDGSDEFRRICDWVFDHLGDDVPLHFTAFHPDFRLRDRPATPHETLLNAYHIARAAGLQFVYVGNVNDVRHQSTYCPQCKRLVVERDWYALGAYDLDGSCCRNCGTSIAGYFEKLPGNWGRRRLPVQISQFASNLAISSQLNQGNTKMSVPVPSSGAAQDSVSSELSLSTEQQDAIHEVACRFVTDAVVGNVTRLSDASLSGAARIPLLGVFVTLKRKGRLRSCCGSLGVSMPLLEALQEAAIATATRDARLPRISSSELEFLDLDVSLLFGSQVIAGDAKDRAKEIEIGKHGLQVARGQYRGLLLPQVAVENGLDQESFLDQVCIKAGLAPTAWKEPETQVRKFSGYSIHGAYSKDVLPPLMKGPEIVGHQEIQRLAEACRINIMALMQGATPNYYLPGCPDGNVVMVGIEIPYQPNQLPWQLAKFSLRPELPLQATLFNLSEEAAAFLSKLSGQTFPADFNLKLTVLLDTAMQGTVASPDLRGIDPQTRAVLVRENSRYAWVFDPQLSAQELLEEAARDAKSSFSETAAVMSMRAVANNLPARMTNVPHPVVGPSVRPPAVAGKFYPADAGLLADELDQLLDKDGSETECWSAVLVPHAGWKFSARIAADVLQRVTIPPSVIVIGPKHTRSGAEWAIAPHQSWSLPGMSVRSDPELAQELAENIDGLELDAAAHQQEHAIEVELPIIARLAPSARVVGIALGNGDWGRCETFAEGLAKVLARRSEPTLLVVSSDMNHHASDVENRRLDEIAMQRIEQLDAPGLLQACRKNHISMCGVVPAVITMETLRRLDRLQGCQRVAYATSADVNGDTRRVVGYAGMLIGES